MQRLRKYLPKLLLGVSIHLAGQFVFAVLVSLGIVPLLVAIVTAVIAAVWAMIIGLPAPVAFVLMLGAFAFTLAIIFWFKKLLTKRKVVSASVASAFQITVGEGGPYFSTGGGVYDIRRTFNLKLENIDRSKSLSGCSIDIMEVVPPTDYEGPWLLKDGISLAAGAHTFVPLVTYGEAREPNKSVRGDTFITMETSTGRPTLDVGPEYIVTLRATAPETAFCEFQCNVWVDSNGRLRIANATTTTADKPGAIPTDVIDRSDSLLPDWPMKELCQHVLDNIDDSEEVIREIEAKARLGELACWGRRYSALRAFDNPNPPRPVPQDHWDDYCLDYLRCVMHEDPTECRTEPRGHHGDHTESYQDLQVNHHQSMSIWPVKSE